MFDYDFSTRAMILENRFATWRTFLRDLEKSAELDHTVVRFPNSSTYIFSTGMSCFWLMDPAFSTTGQKPEELQEIARLIAEKISFIVITHLHGDHCQMELAQLLAESPVRWVIPRCCAERFLSHTQIAKEKLIVLDAGESAELSGIQIAAFPGYHDDPVKQKAVPSAAYEITLPDGIRLFFPADVRNYQLPLPDKIPVDYTFGHVFLGREDTRGNNFSLLDDFCSFMTVKPCGNLILTHLYEVGREVTDVWTCRHASMIQEQLKKSAPQVNCITPCFGDAVHLVKDQARYADPFRNWSRPEKKDFFLSFGISIKMNHEEWMEKAIQNGVNVIEWLPGLALKVPFRKRFEQLDRWRESCGCLLSIHFPNFPLNDDIEAFLKASELAVMANADRITVHVPNVSVRDMKSRFDAVTGWIATLCKPLLARGIRIGIENLHTKPKHTPDESRPFGFTPPECVQLVEALRKKSGSKLWGIHLDIGHAYSNPPYHDRYDTEAWLRECGSLINGMHIHQFEHPRTPDAPFLEGHGNISGRNTGHPSLLPVFKAWEENKVRVPMILEVMRGVEPDPFASLERLKREKGTSIY